MKNTLLFLTLVILFTTSVVFGQRSRPTTHILKPGLATYPVLDKINEWDFAQYMVDIQTPYLGGHVHKIPFYLINKSDFDKPYIGTWTAAEILEVNKCANYWNNSGAALFWYNDGIWANKYKPLAYSSNITGTHFPYGIAKIVAAITDADGNTIWPPIESNGYLRGGDGYSSFSTGNNGDFGNIWMIIINFIPPVAKKDDGLGCWTMNQRILDPTNIDEANNYRVQGLLNLPNNTDFASQNDPAIFKQSASIILIHELGHSLFAGSYYDHDNASYDCRQFTETTTPPGVFNFRDVYTKRYMCVTPWLKPVWENDWDKYSCFDFSDKMNEKQYKYVENNVVYKQTMTQKRYDTETGHGYITSSNYWIPAYVWNPVTGFKLDDENTFFWPFSVMSSAGEDGIGRRVNFGSNQSYSTYGCISLLNDVAMGTAPRRDKWAAAYKQACAVYEYNPVTQREKNGRVCHE